MASELDQIMAALSEAPLDIQRKLFGSPQGVGEREPILGAFERLFRPPQAPSPAAGGTDLSGIMAALEGLRRGPTQQALPVGALQQAGPITFQTGEGGRQTARTITGGFAPGSIGATIEAMLPRILASLTGQFAGQPGGGPTREDLLAPRIGDIESRERAATQALLNRFASLGRSAVGTTTTEGIGEIGRQAGIARQGAFGDVDRILADIATARQGNLLQLLQAFLPQLRVNVNA